MPLSRYLCIGLVSAAALLFQVAQTRLFSASYGYHLTYLVISVSLLGVGSGATLSAIFDRRPRRPGLATLALAAAASALAALILETHIDPGTVLPAAILVAYVAVARCRSSSRAGSSFGVLREDPVRGASLFGDLAGAAIGSSPRFAAAGARSARPVRRLRKSSPRSRRLAVAGPRNRPWRA